jgi:hypothetical protein
MIRAYLARSPSRLQREDPWWRVDRVPVLRPAGGVRCLWAEARRDVSRIADHEDFY